MGEILKWSLSQTHVFARTDARTCVEGCSALPLRWAKGAPKSPVLFWIREKGDKTHIWVTIAPRKFLLSPILLSLWWLENQITMSKGTRACIVDSRFENPYPSWWHPCSPRWRRNLFMDVGYPSRKIKTSDFFDENIRTFEAKHPYFCPKKSDVLLFPDRYTAFSLPSSLQKKFLKISYISYTTARDALYLLTISGEG